MVQSGWRPECDQVAVCEIIIQELIGFCHTKVQRGGFALFFVPSCLRPEILKYSQRNFFSWRTQRYAVSIAGNHLGTLRFSWQNRGRGSQQLRYLWSIFFLFGEKPDQEHDQEEACRSIYKIADRHIDFYLKLIFIIFIALCEG